LAIPLHDLTRKTTTPFKITPEALNAFEKMRDTFSSAPMLIHFDPSKETFLFTDASDFALSGIVHQHGDDGLLHPVSFYSRRLDAPEINYDIHDKEMLGIMVSLKQFRHWLSGTMIPVSVITDHKNLVYFMTQRTLNRLSYAPGAQNPADGPSRREDYMPKEGDTVNEENSSTLLSTSICERLNGKAPTSAYLAVSSLVHLASDSGTDIESLRTALSSDTIWKSAIHRNDPSFESKSDGLVLFRNKIYLPPSFRLKIIKSRHNSALAGHYGAGKTSELIRRLFDWPSLSREVRVYVRGCDSCQ
jgi:hypothetical protein